MKLVRFLAALAVFGVLGGCAHPVTLSPDASKIQLAAKEKVNKKVALYISPEQRALEVTSPGGGGDEIKYFPYKDLETGIYTVLSSQFSDVNVLTDPAKTQGIDYIFKPTITTESSSSSVMLWIATDFTVKIDYLVSDVQGKEVFRDSATGSAKVRSAEVMQSGNLSLSSTLASEKALSELSAQLNKSPLVK